MAEYHFNTKELEPRLEAILPIMLQEERVKHDNLQEKVAKYEEAYFREMEEREAAEQKYKDDVGAWVKKRDDFLKLAAEKIYHHPSNKGFLWGHWRSLHNCHVLVLKKFRKKELKFEKPPIDPDPVMEYFSLYSYESPCARKEREEMNQAKYFKHSKTVEEILSKLKGTDSVTLLPEEVDLLVRYEKKLEEQDG